MGDLALEVPLVGQKTSYSGQPLMQPGADGKLRQHGFMVCWLASAEMVSYYYRAGPRQGLPDVWKPDKGLTLKAIDDLAKIEGLKRLAKPADGLTTASVEQLLRANGPIWAAGNYMDAYPTAGHVIVLFGVMGGQIAFNDPWEPQRKVKPVDWISSKMLNIPNAMLVKDQTRS